MSGEHTLVVENRAFLFSVLQPPLFLDRQVTCDMFYIYTTKIEKKEGCPLARSFKRKNT